MALVLAVAAGMVAAVPAGARGSGVRSTPVADPAVFSVGAATETLSPPYFRTGAPFPDPVPASCVAATPAGSTPAAYFNGVRHFALEDPFHVDAGAPPDEYVPADPTSGRPAEAYCKLDPGPVVHTEYGHPVSVAQRYETLYLAGGDGQNRIARVPESALPGHDGSDDLAAVALVVGRAGTRVALASVDSIGTFLSDFDRVRHQVAAERPDLAGMQIVLASTHDESAPDPIGIWGPDATTPGVDHLYMDFLVAQTARAIERAADAAVPARLRITEARDPDTFLPCFSSYPYLADRSVHLLQAVAVGSGATLATVSEYGMHDELLGFSGEPAGDAPYQRPDSADPTGHYRRVMGGDAQGAVRRHLAGTFGGVGMALPGAVGSVEMPVVFPAGTPVSRTPLFDAAGVPRKADISKTMYGDCGRSSYSPPAEAPETIDQLTRADLIGRDLAADAAAALAAAPFTTDPTLSGSVSPDFFVPLTNNASFAAAGNAGLFPDRPVYTGTPGGAPVPTAQNGTGLATRVSRLRIADAEFVTLPGEMFPQTTIRGHLGPEQMPFPDQPITPWITAGMTAPHRFVLGLGEDMVGYLMPPGAFVGECTADDGKGQCVVPEATDDPWRSYELADHHSDDRFGEHHSDDSESVGPTAASLVAAQITALTAAQRDRRAMILPGRYVDPDGSLDRSPLHSPVAVAVRTPGGSALMVYRLPGRPAPTGMADAPVAASVIDSDGVGQGGADESTQGVLLAGCGGAASRIYVDVYPDLDSASGVAPASPCADGGPDGTLPEAPWPVLLPLAALAVAWRISRSGGPLSGSRRSA